MKKILHLILLFAVLSFAQTGVTSLGVWLTTSSSLSKDECVFVSEIIKEAAEHDLSGSVTVIKGKKTPADYYVESRVTKMGSWYHVSVELYRSSGGQPLNSYSERSKDVDAFIEKLQAAMPGFFSVVLAAGVDSAAETEQVSAVVPEQEEASNAENLQEPLEEESAPAVEIDLAGVQYQDDGKGGVLKPANASDPSYKEYEKYVWSSVVAMGMDAAGEFSTGPQEKTLSYPMVRLGLSASLTYNDFWGSSLGLDNLNGKYDGYSLESKGADDLLHNYWGFGFDAGLGFLFMVSPSFGLHVEAAFALRQGTGKSNMSVVLKWDDSSREAEGDDIEVEYSEKQMNIDIPVMLRLAIPNVIYVEAGVNSSLCLGSEVKSQIDSYWGSSEYKEKDFCNFFELGAVVGLGVMKPIGSKAIDLNFRLVLGLTALNDEPEAPKTMQIQFNTTFWFI